MISPELATLIFAVTHDFYPTVRDGTMRSPWQVTRIFSEGDKYIGTTNNGYFRIELTPDVVTALYNQLPEEYK